VVRSLSRYGVRVHVLADRSSLVGASRHCAELVDLGTGDDRQDRWREWLAKGPRGAVVLPVGDDGLELVARQRSWLKESGYIPFEADDEVLLAMLDKHRTYELAARAGVATPASTLVSSPSDADSVAEEVGFPCALKPLHSHLFSRHFDAKLFLVGGREELAELVARTSSLGLAMLATAIVPGGDERYCSYYSYIDERGEPLFHFTKRKVRQYPIHFGLGTYHLTDWNPEVAAEGLRFFQGVGLRGLANVEFKRDSRDETLKLIECNHRFTAANELVRLAGIDLAVLTYNRLLGQPLPKPARYRTGVRFWSQLDDVKAARAYRRAGELSYRAWFLSLLHRQHSYFFDWRDPGPTLLSWRRKAARRLRRPRT
jgi:D-aspartate ligase